MNKTSENIDAETGEVLDKVNTTIGAGNQIVPRGPSIHPEDIAARAAQPPAMPVTGFGKLAEAIALITAEVAADPIKKEGRNKFHNYSYARMQDILNGLTPMMAKHGVVIMQTEVQRGLLDNGNVIFATYDFTIMHKSGEVWPFPQRQTGTSKVRDSKGGYDDKGLNKCHTSARKYFLLSLFQIPTTDDDDADQGANDGYGRGRPVPKKDEKPAQQAGDYPDEGVNQAPQDPPAEKEKPHAIPRPKGISAATWGGKYIEQIMACETVAEIDSWAAANKDLLDTLEEFAPKISGNVKTAVDRRIQWITTPQ